MGWGACIWWSQSVGVESVIANVIIADRPLCIRPPTTSRMHQRLIPGKSLEVHPHWRVRPKEVL
jgi:hypothetical protein